MTWTSWCSQVIASPSTWRGSLQAEEGLSPGGQEWGAGELCSKGSEQFWVYASDISFLKSFPQSISQSETNYKKRQLKGIFFSSLLWFLAFNFTRVFSIAGLRLYQRWKRCKEFSNSFNDIYRALHCARHLSRYWEYNRKQRSLNALIELMF